MRGSKRWTVKRRLGACEEACGAKYMFVLTDAILRGYHPAVSHARKIPRRARGVGAPQENNHVVFRGGFHACWPRKCMVRAEQTVAPTPPR